MSPLPLRRAPGRRGLRLWPVGPVLALVFTGAVLIAAAVFAVTWNLLDAQGLEHERRLSSKTLFDLVKLSFGVVAGAGALVVAYRRQRVDEEAALREATPLHTERFTTAVTQLGHESPAVRLGGVHALTGLADDAPTTTNLRQACIDVLCAYLRLPYTPETALPAGDTIAHHEYLALRQVRHTVIRLVRDHLRLDPATNPHSWRGHDLDFTDVVFDGGDFTQAVFTADPTTGLTGTVDFTRAQFTGGKVDFSRAQFSGSAVDFVGARFSGGAVVFSRAQFSGGRVGFTHAQFSGGSPAAGSTSSTRSSPVARSTSLARSSPAARSASSAHNFPGAQSTSPARRGAARPACRLRPGSPYRRG
ncbi:pentapeptide repeat-containing protein [Streptomyces sp. SID3343]|uniref:pentapeptide repeat-containing protein n=1 Tax=Streptomyces sp. SID3343 TaxID=2690260 RepID=UPI0031F7AAC9